MSEDVREFVPTQENMQTDLNTLFRDAIHQVLAAALEAEVEQLVRAPRGKRVSGRADFRNGSYARTVMTTVGELEVEVPRTRHHGAAIGPLNR